MSKLWGGRFEKLTDRQVETFSESLSIDERLWEADIRGSIAHARALGNAGVLPHSEAQALIQGLDKVGADLEAKTIQFDPRAEDVHSEIERLLSENLGELAGKLHTGRSRNDQVGTATRLYLRDQVDHLAKEIAALQTWIVSEAEKNLHTILPGMTHFQHAQPVSLAHHLMAYFWMLKRDRERLADCRKRINELPLGSAALAGTPFQVNRETMAHELGFDRVCENSLDAVSDRDFAVEFLAAASLIMVHLSRLCEELIVWSTPEFGFLELGDEVTTGSSIMPQKKNPDVAELIRGRSGRSIGSLLGLLTVLKGLPLSYNRDLQEDKVHLFSGLDNTRACVRLMCLMLSHAKFKKERMAEALLGDFSTATDLADCLVMKGLPFRQAHEVVGKIVSHCLKMGIGLEQVTADVLQQFSPLCDESTLACLKPSTSMNARISRGGTSPQAVFEQIRRAKESL